ncbi:hypothetical protein FHT32_006986 [Variovorax sp. SG517]|uniref:hypothetical protein n=1 Tax=Variovorax sp. SG517 TaxID=2587117 RepID=UPI00159DF2D5|nr:hypothetical protein [Variovorax sp. SG517]NVM93289.1 hypothetical protein [Variovorax sp. SG517]
MKLASDTADSTPWDFSFEKEFDAADNHFPPLITWLESLERRSPDCSEPTSRYLAQPATDEQLRAITESVVSLAARSPATREASVAFAEDLRGPLASSERNALIGLSMRNYQRTFADSIGSNAKFAVLFSPKKEFIYGDGFFHNLKAPTVAPRNPKLLVPITPSMSVIISKPRSFTAIPRLSTIVLRELEVDQCNHAIQVYSCKALFYRSERPLVNEFFRKGEHLEYARTDNPIDELIGGLPGVTPDFRVSNPEL